MILQIEKFAKFREVNVRPKFKTHNNKLFIEMDSSLEKALNEVIPKILPFFENQEKIDSLFMYKIKKQIRTLLPESEISIFKNDIAKFLLIFLIRHHAAQNSENLDPILLKYPFIRQNLDSTEIEIIIDKYISTEDDFSEEEITEFNQDYLSTDYFSEDTDWYKEIGLIDDPFPSQDGLFLIQKEYYELLVLKTKLFNKYNEMLDQDEKSILNKSVVFYGDFGCGKTTFFDYLDNGVILKGILPIRIILNAKPSLALLHNAFNEDMFNELADYLSKFSNDPRGNLLKVDKHNILKLFHLIMTERGHSGFIIFLDGLHKSQDNVDSALNFLIELQNIIDFYRRKDIPLSIFIAGSLEWEKKIKHNKKFSGSFFSLEKFDSLSPLQSYEMLMRRFDVFSPNKGRKYIKYSEIEMLVNSIKKTLATDINFRNLIKNFLRNGFIFKNRIKIKPLIEEDVLNNIYEAIKKNKFLFSFLIKIQRDFTKEPTRLRKLMKVISTLFDLGYINKDHSFYVKHKKNFQFLANHRIIQLNDKYQKKNGIPYSLSKQIHKTFKDIENKVKFRPTHYLILLFMKTYTPIQKRPEYMDILDTIRRFKENNPHISAKIEELTESRYFNLIKEIKNIFQNSITNETVQEMNSIIEDILTYLYELAEEPFKISTQKELFNIFKYTWLDNQVLSQYLTWQERWNPNIDDKNSNLKFLSLFIDTFESLVHKIGKHILYNKILIIGSKFLNNEEKIELNSARAFFSNNNYIKCIKKCHDILEKTLRTYIFNVLRFKYGDNWINTLPNEIKRYIEHIKKKDKARYGKFLSQNGNSLYYLSRNHYSIIFEDKKLWKNCFSPILGSAYKSFLIENLDNLANLGHLEKHNRTNEELAEISELIEHYLINSKKIIEKINESYSNLIQLTQIKIDESTLLPKFNSREDESELEPISLSKKQINELRQKIQAKNEENRNFNNFFSISDENLIKSQLLFNYREFIGLLIYLMHNQEIEILEIRGSDVIISYLCASRT